MTVGSSRRTPEMRGDSMTGLEDLTRPGLALIVYLSQIQLLLGQ